MLILKSANARRNSLVMRLYYIGLVVLSKLFFRVNFSCARLGFVCEQLSKGTGREIWARRARYYYIKALLKGESAGVNNIASCYATGALGFEKNPQRAVELYAKASENGFAGAMHNLGWCYYSGEGVKPDKEKAAKLFCCASDLDFPYAHYYLGLLYLRGEGVPRDTRKAVKLLKKAARHGIADAQYDLSVCYRDGDDGRRRIFYAAFWMLMSALNGCKCAKEIIEGDELGDFLSFKNEDKTHPLKPNGLESRTDTRR